MNILSFSIVAFLLTDQLLALATPFSSGLGLIVFILCLALSLVPELKTSVGLLRTFKRKLTLTNCLLPVLLVPYSLFCVVNAPCNGQITFAIATVLLIVFTWFFIKIYVEHIKFKNIIEPNHALFGLLLIYFFLCMAANGYDLYSMLQEMLTNRPSGLYSEPSHLILYASPLIFTVIHDNKTRLLGILLTIFIFVLAFTVTNAALISLVMFFYTSHYFISRKELSLVKGNFIIFVVMILFALSFNRPYIQDRLNVSQEINVSQETRNLSTLVYLNGWLLAKESLLNTSGTGLGLGSMGCSESINNSSSTLSAFTKTYDGEIICARSGSFLASKIISELGVLGVLILIYIAFKLLCFFKVGVSRKFDLILYGTVSLTITLLFIRGTTYFSAPSIFCLLMMLNYSHAPAVKKSCS